MSGRIEIELSEREAEAWGAMGGEVWLRGRIAWWVELAEHSGMAHARRMEEGRQNNSLQRWIVARVAPGDGWVRSLDLYADYRAFAPDSQISLKRFVGELGRYGYQGAKRGGFRAIDRIRLLDVPHQSASL